MQFWNQKKVLITGGTGFVGSNLARTLSGLGAKVVLITRQRNKPKILQKSDNIFLKVGDIQDFEFINNLLRRNNIEVIFHLAAQPIVDVGQLDPLQTFNINIKGTWNILEVSRINPIQKIIIASSVHVYGDNPKLPFKEEFYPRPSRPYETSKACADLLAQSYADTYNLPVEIPRFVNLYGPGDLNFSRIVPKVIKSVLDKKNPKLWNKGSIRDFLYIDDAINAFLMLAEKKLPSKGRVRVTNFGSGKPVDIVYVAKRIIEISNNRSLQIEFESIPRTRSKEIIKQYVSISKAKELLNWTPKYSLDQGLKMTFKWYKSNLISLK